MNWLFTIITILIFVALISIFKIKSKENVNRDLDQSKYKKNKTLFTPAERSFLGVLNQVIKDDAVVFGKVRVADVLSPIDNLERRNWQILFNKISSKHFDFIICDKKNLNILCAIELDGKSHNSKKRKERDIFLDSACNSASFPLIHILAQASYNLDDIRNKVISSLEVSE